MPLWYQWKRLWFDLLADVKQVKQRQATLAFVPLRFMNSFDCSFSHCFAVPYPSPSGGLDFQTPLMILFCKALTSTYKNSQRHAHTPNRHTHRHRHPPPKPVLESGMTDLCALRKHLIQKPLKGRLLIYIMTQIPQESCNQDLQGWVLGDRRCGLLFLLSH